MTGDILEMTISRGGARLRDIAVQKKMLKMTKKYDPRGAAASQNSSAYFFAARRRIYQRLQEDSR
jgi:hypothetical protein